ncbi:hypothetical protein RCH22_003011 [Cryobacterium psychrotolerans]|nr:hypothetical protein [Cryobacterium psychrotolerans]
MSSANVLQYVFGVTECRHAVIWRYLSLLGNPFETSQRWVEVFTQASANLQRIDNAIVSPGGGTRWGSTVSALFDRWTGNANGLVLSRR